MAPAAAVSEALTMALCRVALEPALCQAVCVATRRLGSCRGARGLRVKAEAPFDSSQCHPLFLFSAVLICFCSSLYFCLHLQLTLNSCYLQYARRVPLLGICAISYKDAF